MRTRLPAPSAHDVARLAGVSQAAVSRAFTPGASIAETTRARVIEAAQTLGYRPNLLARSLIMGRSGIVGVVVSQPRYPFFLAALDTLSARLSQAGKHILVYTADGPADARVEDLLKYRIDALLLMAARITPQMAQKCRAAGIPVIAFSAARDMEGFASVTGDNLGGGEAIARHLLAQGYRRPAVIAGLEDTTSSEEREAGFTRHLAAAGLPPPERAVGRFRRAEGMEAARTLLSKPERPDELFCANDDMALGALEVARFEFGFEIGRELGVAGFDDIEQAAWPSFDLTSYALPVEAVIEQVTDMLCAPDLTALPANTMIAGELKVRGSTRRG